MITRHVLEFPPSDSVSNLVNFESLYGIKPLLPEVRALITLPRADKDLLIILASSRFCPVTSVLLIFSEPAKSQQYNFPIFEVSVSVFF